MLVYRNYTTFCNFVYTFPQKNYRKISFDLMVDIYLSQYYHLYVEVL